MVKLRSQRPPEVGSHLAPRASPRFCVPEVGHTSGFTAPAGCPRWGHHSEARGVPHPLPCAGYRIHHTMAVAAPRWVSDVSCRAATAPRGSGGQLGGRVDHHCVHLVGYVMFAGSPCGVCTSYPPVCRPIRSGYMYEGLWIHIH